MRDMINDNTKDLSHLGLGPVIATGIDTDNKQDNIQTGKDKFIETGLPFYYFLYALEKDFSLSISGKKITLKKHHGVFVKKSVPFTVLLDWQEHGLSRTDICVVRFTTQNISDFNVLYDNDFEKLKKVTMNKHTPLQYVVYDLSEKATDELRVFHWMIEAAALDIVQGLPDSNHKRKIKNSFIFSYLIDNNINIEKIFHDVAPVNTSEQIAHIIIEDYSINWSVDDLAKKLCMSPSALKKKMYDEVGSISIFVCKLKLTEALRRLRRTQESISEIAYSLGFCSSSHFSQMFKKYFGLSPSKIRRQRDITYK